MAAASSRFANINENDIASLTKMVRGGSEINVFSDGYIQEIQLNFYPPSAQYSTSHHQCYAVEKNARCKYCGSCNNASSVGGGNEEENCLSIDVLQEATNSISGGSKSGNSSGYGGMNDSEGEESQKKATNHGNFSHIAFKRSDSILHISIGNSSKVLKRRKRHRWIFTKLYKLSRKGSGSEGRKSSSKESYNSPESSSKDGSIFHLNNMSGLNMINDNIVISINKKSRSTTQHNNEICQNQFRSILNGDMIHGGANELDLYMNEIKMREMG
jgi:hypothetical protein